MTTDAASPIGAILCGGRSRRMGTDKAMALLAGRPLILHVATALNAAGCDAIAIGRTAAPGELVALPDDVPGSSGPAAGLVTALRLAGDRPVFLAAADQPLLRPSTVRRLLALPGDAVAPEAGGTRQTTCAVYRSGCLEPLLEIMTRDRSPSLQALLDIVDTRQVDRTEWTAWGEDGRSWWSLDTPSDLAEAEVWLAEHPRSPDPG